MAGYGTRTDVGLYFRHPSSLLHETGSHPECPDRIRAIERALDDAGWAGLELREAQPADRAQLELVHTAAHIERIEAFCRSGGGMLDMDTIAVEASWDAALRAAGGASQGAAAVLGGEAPFAVSGMRPPGHHAESDRAMGFCLFNSVAVAAASAIDSGAARRVLILDWDVHHGNGTAQIFAARDDVLYISIHQSPLYPGTGHPREIGTGAGEGYTVNLPVPAGADGPLFLSLVQHVVAPIAREFSPDLLAISAGFDAHADDPLADCELLDSDYAQMTASMRALGTELGAPLLICLEGGYELDALGRSMLATVRAAGDSLAPAVAPLSPSAAARDHFRGRWRTLAAN